MPYRVYEASEFEALAAPETETGSDGPRASRYQDALNRLEEDGYRLVAVDTTGSGEGGLYVFHRADPDSDVEPHRRISNMR